MAYVDGFVAAVPSGSREAYVAHARAAWPIFERLGAQALWECWGDDVPAGAVTSFPLAVKAGPDETVVLSFTLWPDKATRDAAWARMMAEPDMMAEMGEMPFDGTRMIHGGFQPILTAGARVPGPDAAPQAGT